MTPDLSIYLVTDAGQSAGAGRSLVDTVLAGVAGGATTVQVREKSSARDTLEAVTALAAALPSHVTLLVNDRVDVFLAARDAGARVHGVHVGQDDLPALQVRTLIGPEPVLGVTANTAAQLRAISVRAVVDYVGIGTVRTTASKADAPAALGVDGVIALAQSVALPAVAIGGVTPEDLPALRRGGLAGAAVVSWICAAPDPRAAAAELSGAWAVAA
ncbi:thiamine phosphate synthase [Demequina sp.]|uniref:thiamine phosphate synthase n=1 Tax=Demequina sp. TaxID=2050685 RepID=UPI003A85DDDA